MKRPACPGPGSNLAPMQRSVTTSAPLPLGSRLRRLLVALLVIANVAVFAMLFYLNGIKEAVVESIETIPP